MSSENANLLLSRLDADDDDAMVLLCHVSSTKWDLNSHVYILFFLYTIRNVQRKAHKLHSNKNGICLYNKKIDAKMIYHICNECHLHTLRGRGSLWKIYSLVAHNLVA